jgi:xanthine dehydrogenase accessory factor
MPANSYYLIMTHSHQLDFEILETVLQRGDARYVGLIGSETKWARFRHRFQHRGHDESFFRCVRCPVGLAAVPGKLPIEVAVSIAAEIIGVCHENRRAARGGEGISREELRRLAAEGDASCPVSVSGDSPTRSRDPL